MESVSHLNTSAVYLESERTSFLLMAILLLDEEMFLTFPTKNKIKINTKLGTGRELLDTVIVISIRLKSKRYTAFSVVHPVLTMFIPSDDVHSQ